MSLTRNYRFTHEDTGETIIIEALTLTEAMLSASNMSSSFKLIERVKDNK